MNELQKIVVIIAIILFVLMGVATLLLLFVDFSLGQGSIAVVEMKGDIADGNPATDGVISADMMRQVFSDLKDDPTIVAVVLDINSGGGSVVESKEISRALADLAQEKPVVAYIGDVGASGAYYVASFANTIVADEDSLVGSIGVISTHMEYKTLLEDKLGINTTVIKSGKYKDIGSPYREMTPDEKQQFQDMVDTIHKEFLNAVATNRGLTADAINTVDTSTIFLGSEALRLGLVDYNGGLHDAVDIAGNLASSPDAQPYFVDYSDYYSGDASSMYYNLGRGIGESIAARIDSKADSLQLTA